MLIGAGGAVLAYKMHYWVERKFKIDDAVGAVAVHGYAGFYGIVVAGFMLWGYPSSPFEGYAAISPWGNFLGALIMFFVLGFFPALIVAKILNGLGALRIPREIELVGLDINHESLRSLEAEELAQAIRQEAG
jgi:ammonia channel protein AmtB